MHLCQKQKKNADLFKGKTLKEMRAMSADELMKLKFNPGVTIDGKVISDTVQNILKKNGGNKVNMITGNCTGDGSLSQLLTIGNLYAPMNTLSKADFEKALNDKVGKYVKECLEAYPVIGNDALSQYQQLDLDSMLVNQYYFAKLRALKLNKDTNVYSFAHALPGRNNVSYGAFHTADVPYWLGTLGTITSERSKHFTKTDSELSKAMMFYMLNFAKTGNPNGAGFAQWVAYNAGAMTNFYIGDNTFATEGFSHRKIQFWQDYYNDVLGLK
jgi:para-nitrobenzyl esterase